MKGITRSSKTDKVRTRIRHPTSIEYKCILAIQHLGCLLMDLSACSQKGNIAKTRNNGRSPMKDFWGSIALPVNPVSDPRSGLGINGVRKASSSTGNQFGLFFGWFRGPSNLKVCCAAFVRREFCVEVVCRNMLIGPSMLLVVPFVLIDSSIPDCSPAAGLELDGTRNDSRWATKHLLPDVVTKF
jgi:hypothetical protein